MVKVTGVFPPLPLITCVGLRVHVLNGGQLPEYAKIALLGNEPPEGTTSRVKIADCPAGTDWRLEGGVIVKLNPGGGPLPVEVKLARKECVVAFGSLPTPVISKL
jgi:hypothetical protein